MSKHSMMVPDRIWEWGKRHFNVNNPSDHFRILLAIAMGSEDSQTFRDRVDVGTKLPSENPIQKRFDPGKYSDPFPSAFPGYCWGSGEHFESGALICMKNNRPYLIKWVRENS